MKLEKHLFIFLICMLHVHLFAQKKEFKSIESALKRNKIEKAKSIVQSLEYQVDNMNTDYKAKFYFLKGNTYSTLDYKKSAEAYVKLLVLEKQLSNNKYRHYTKPKRRYC